MRVASAVPQTVRGGQLMRMLGKYCAAVDRHRVDVSSQLRAALLMQFSKQQRQSRGFAGARRTS